MYQIYVKYAKILRKKRQQSQVDIAFAAGCAFMACEENGFSSKVDVFDLASLERVLTLDLLSTTKCMTVR